MLHNFYNLYLLFLYLEYFYNTLCLQGHQKKFVWNSEGGNLVTVLNIIIFAPLEQRYMNSNSYNLNY